MRLTKLSCPACGANIQMELQGRTDFFCNYCGSKILIEDGKTSISKTVNINKNINVHKQYSDEAAIEKQRRKDRENERAHKETKWIMIGLLIILVLDFAFLDLGAKKEEREEQRLIEAGMIPAGMASSDMEGKKYEGIVEQLELSGFSNIVTVDMDDAGLFKNKSDTIDHVTINGDSDFSSSDLFDPDSKIIISYH